MDRPDEVYRKQKENLRKYGEWSSRYTEERIKSGKKCAFFLDEKDVEQGRENNAVLVDRLFIEKKGSDTLVFAEIDGKVCRLKTFHQAEGEAQAYLSELSRDIEEAKEYYNETSKKIHFFNIG